GLCATWPFIMRTCSSLALSTSHLSRTNAESPVIRISRIMVSPSVFAFRLGRRHRLVDPSIEIGNLRIDRIGELFDLADISPTAHADLKPLARWPTHEKRATAVAGAGPLCGALLP